MADSGVGVSLMVEQSITIGNIVEIIVIAVGGVTVFTTMRNTVKYINEKVDAIQVEIKKLADILITQAILREQINNLDKRVTAHDTKLEELAHGDGYVRSTKT